MISYKLHLTISFVFILVIFLFSSSLFPIVRADVSQYVKLNLSEIDFGNIKFKETNCSKFTAFSLYHYSDLFHMNIKNVEIEDLASIDYSIDETNELGLLPSSELPNLNNKTQKPTWYVQERPSCSNIILFTLEELKRYEINILDFRDSRLGELSPKGAPSQQCLACDDCVDAYLLILTDDELSKHLGFKRVDSMEKYIDRIKNGK